MDSDFEYDETDESDPFLVPPEAFQYLPPPEFGGPKGPVRIPLDSNAAPPRPQPGFLARLLGAPEPPRPQNDWELRMDAAAGALAARLAGLGAVKAYIRFDGGCDEGFAWFDSCLFADGSSREGDRVAEDLEPNGAKEDLAAIYPQGGDIDLREALDDMATAWAVRLLGEGFGTGEYVMYGGAWVDLKTGLITDDPDPAPVVKNIEFGKPG